jgi:hypothetical protein
MQPFAYDPLSQDNIAALNPISSMLPGGDVNTTRPPLSIDTSFIDDWNHSSPSTAPSSASVTSSSSSSSSSSSPSSPSYPDSPSPSSDPYAYTVDSFDPAFTKPFDSQPSPFHVYSNTCRTPFEQHGNAGVYINSPSEYVAFDHEHPKAELAHLDLEFSAFMASLPQYSL